MSSVPQSDAGESNPLGTLQSLGKYEIRKQLGAGGMGIVFLAFDTDLKRTVALKVLAKERAENPQLVRRFKSEAQAAAQLRHPNIVAVYEAGEADGYLYIALEYVEGHDVLTQIRKRGILPPKRSLHMIRQIADALDHAAERNIVHRDIKPSNIMVQQDGTVKLADLGLARSIDDTLETDITRAGTTVGTVDYMSPEQARDSKAADIRSDIYSLGCSWYHMLGGIPPFSEGSMTNKLQAHATANRPDPRDLNPNVPDGYVAVMHRMMAKRPEDRYQTPAELILDLDKVGNIVAGVNAALMQALQQEAPADDSATGQAAARAARQANVLDPAEEHVSQKMKVKPILPGEGPSKSSSRRSATTDSVVDEVEAAPESPLKGKIKRSAANDQPELPPRKGRRSASTSTDSSAENGSETRSKRSAPPRVGNPAQPAFQIDIDYLRFGLIGAVVIGLFGVGYWLLTRGGGGPADLSTVNQNALVNPQENGPLPAENPIIAPPPDTEETPRSPEYLLVPVEDVSITREGEPFPGTGDLSGPETPEVRSLVPDWVYAVRGGIRLAAKTVAVDPQGGAGAVITLHEALRSSGDAEVLHIELKGEGPFELQPSVLTRRRHVRISATAGSQPIVFFRGSPLGGAASPHLEMKGGLLEIIGLHLVFPRTGEETTHRSAIGVEAGTLVMNKCTFTASGNSEIPLTVCRASNGAQQPGAAQTSLSARPTRILLYRSVIRGDNVTAVSSISHETDIVIGGSFIATSRLPAMDIAMVEPPRVTAPPKPAHDSSPANSTESTATSATSPSEKPSPPSGKSDVILPKDSYLRLLGSTIVTTSGSLQLRKNGETPASCQIQIRRSIQSSGTSTGGCCVHITDWTQTAGSPPSATPSKSRAPGLKCGVEFAPFLGWETLVRMERTVGPLTAVDAAAWQSFWGSALPEDAIVPGIDGLTPSTLERSQPVAIAKLLEPIMSLAAYRGHVPGADVAQLPIPPDQSIDRQRTLASKPQLPPGFFPFTVAQSPFVVDLKKDADKLTEILNGPNVPDGSHVQLIGTGLKRIAPFAIRNKHVRLQFLDDGTGAAMVIQAAPAAGAGPAAFITVENGRVDIVGLNYRWPADAPGVPQRFVLLTDSDLALSQSRIEGALTAGKDRLPLIEWNAGTPNGKRQYVAITSTMVSGDVLLGGPMQNRLISLQNSILAARGTAILMKALPTDVAAAPETDGWLQVNHCTLAAAFSLLHSAGESPANLARPTLNVAVTDSIYCPLPGLSPDASLLLAHAANSGPTQRINWWESRCGYHPGVARFHGPPSDKPQPSQQFVKDWSDLWGKDRIDTPLTGASAVLFSTIVTSPDNLTPRLFGLQPSSTANTWGLGGSALGPNLNSVGVAQPTRPSPGPNQTNPNTPSGTKPRGNDL